MSKTIIAIIIVIIIVAVGYWAYQSAGPEEELEEETPVVEEEEGPTPEISTTTAQVGQIFTIVLEANPTTGYSWQVDNDEEFVTLESRDYIVPEPAEGEEPLVGAGGEETFTFNALQAGNTEITFSYAKEWEAEVPPIEIKVYQVTIEEAEETLEEEEAPGEN